MIRTRFAVLAILILAAGCEEVSPETDRTTARQTEQIMQEANAQVGMPAIVNFTERKFAKMIYELRDQELQTWTYIIDMNGGRHLICESVGYGLPYSTQYSNPIRTVRSLGSGGIEQLPQPEPNGLWTPEGLSATWVLCADSQGGVRPVYVEPQILVSPFQL